uniref:Uncharacterized protein n=1 Tax=Mus musculus TaxID=10090 RepID=Q8C6Q8_MOUSE|nr:unnamed protein product [Mus musculus]
MFAFRLLPERRQAGRFSWKGQQWNPVASLAFCAVCCSFTRALSTAPLTLNGGSSTQVLSSLRNTRACPEGQEQHPHLGREHLSGKLSLLPVSWNYSNVARSLWSPEERSSCLLNLAFSDIFGLANLTAR